MQNFPQGHLGPLLHYCSHLIRQCSDQQMRQYGLTPVQSQTLLFLSRHPQAGQRELERFLHVKPSTTNGLVERLVQKGLLERSVDPADARRRCLALTKEGRRYLEEIEAVLQRSEEKSRRDFTAQEERQLRCYLLRMIANLEDNTTC